MTEEQREIMRRALGLTRASLSYRNHFAPDTGSEDHQHCEALVAAGLMSPHSLGFMTVGTPLYEVTLEGLEALSRFEAQR